MRRIPLWIPFTLALCFALFGSAFLPKIRIWAFSPFLALLYHRVPFSKALWISFACGLLFDCFSTQLRFGLFSLSHVLVSVILYSQKRHFFEEKALALSLFSIVISFFLSLFHLLFCCWSGAITWSLPLACFDLVLMPFLEGVYAFCWFTCPFWLILYFRKYGLKHLIPQEEDPS